MIQKFEFLVTGLPDIIVRMEESGNFKQALLQIDQFVKAHPTIPKLLKLRLDWEKERITRILADYKITKVRALRFLTHKVNNLTPQEFETWMNNRLLEWRVINGTSKLFNHFWANFLRTHETIKTRLKTLDKRTDTQQKLVHTRIDMILQKAQHSDFPYVSKVKNRIFMKLKIKQNAVDRGDTVRVWLPYPTTTSLQSNITLIGATQKNYFLAPTSAPQRTIYMEQVVKDTKNLVFGVEYEYTTSAFYTTVNVAKIKPYKKDTLYKNYTTEQLPHIAFTPYLKKLAYEIVENEENPYLKAYRVYAWITENIHYALVPEYSTIPQISDYAARNLKGDCGVQALLFITLCRIVGVPARWQSGWYITPKLVSPHDWAQFYIEPYGWLYADPSIGGHEKSIDKYHKFYFGNIDHFRMIANVQISTPFEPRKKHYRSDTIDNQRGEVETTTKNLYFDKWSYKLKLLEHHML